MMGAAPPPPPGGPADEPARYEGSPPPTQPPPPPGQEAPHQYGGPPQGWGDEQASRSSTNGLAIGALVCGILALLCGIFGLLIVTLPLALILGIVAVVLGVMGKRRAAENGVGRGQAMSGLVTGAIGLVAMVGWVILFAVGWSAMVGEFGSPFDDPEGFQQEMEELEQGEDI